MADPLVKTINPIYLERLMAFNGFTPTGSLGTLFKIQGFDSYNHLLDVNSMFSNNPNFDPVDRTGMVRGPIRYSAERPWTIPISEITLESALEKRVTELCAIQGKINLFWSGGIDSTTIVVSFLQYAPDLGQLRVIYSPWSTYEHPDFFRLLQTIPGIELVDTSGEIYLDFDLDGIFVSGNASDEIHASLDESFFQQYGYDFLSTPWRDFFYGRLPDDRFIGFCEQHFSASGRDINTVLEARWWFYASTKLTSILNNWNLAFFLTDHNRFDPKRLIGFFDCEHYERFIYFNIDKIIQDSNYASWRQFLKDYCFRYDGFNEWRVNKSKFHSSQLLVYEYKKQILNDSRYLMLLDDGTRVSTPNLPLFSNKEWNRIRENYQHVFRPNPDTL